MHEAGGPGRIPLLFFMHELGLSKGSHFHHFHRNPLPNLIPCLSGKQLQYLSIVWIVDFIPARYYLIDMDFFKLDSTCSSYFVKYALFQKCNLY